MVWDFKGAVKAMVIKDASIHNCEEHLKYESWGENYMLVEELVKCSVCGRVKRHWAYGELLTDNWIDVVYDEGQV